MTTDNMYGMSLHEAVRQLLCLPEQCSVTLLWRAFDTRYMDDEGKWHVVGVEWSLENREEFRELMRRNPLSLELFARRLLLEGVPPRHVEILTGISPTALGDIIVERVLDDESAARRQSGTRGEAASGPIVVPQFVRRWMSQCGRLAVPDSLDQPPVLVDTYESYWHFLDKEQFIKVVCAIGRTWPEWIFAANHGAANYDRVVAFLRRFDNEQAVAWAQLFIEDAAQRIVDLRSVDLGVFAHLSLSTREAMVRRSRLSIPHLVQLLAEMAESGMRWHTFDLLTGLTHIFMACDEEQYPAWLKLRNNLPVHGIDVQIDDLFRRVHVKRGQVVTRADNEVGCGGLRIRNRGGYLVPLRYPDGQRVRSGDVLIHSRRDESWTRCLLCGAKRVFRATLVSRGEADT